MQTTTETSTSASRLSLLTTDYSKLSKDALCALAVERGICKSKSAAREILKAALIGMLQMADDEAFTNAPEPAEEPAPVETAPESTSALVEPSGILFVSTDTPKRRVTMTGAQRAAKRKRNKRKHHAEIRRRDYH